MFYSCSNYIRKKLLRVKVMIKVENITKKIIKNKKENKSFMLIMTSHLKQMMEKQLEYLVQMLQEKLHY